MEAQNTGVDATDANDAASADPNRTSTQKSVVFLPVVSVNDITLASRVGRPTVTRSWAVETRLRRQFVGVPAPLRDTRPDPGSRTGGEENSELKSTSSPREITPVKRRLPVLVEATPAPPRIDSDAGQPATQPMLRNPVRRRDPSPPTDTLSQTDHASTESSRSRAETFAKTHQVGQLDPTASNTQTAQVKASSILKLVGTGPSELSGKSRDELIEEYKRARRIELEAMMRTMVQR
ncbi:unnamed protein product [Phytophthora fragariaefolia]|uniref:Unnamed protein product n=1 Tax=Phytophthora fragariaefolia TaxID=1490495 RepID=A0A9W6XQN7_9STRA|nr:unnamed protein product [Phytophthora fragariaefolia]